MMKNTVVCGIIQNDTGDILVVDKHKDDGRVLTILPGGKPDEGESARVALKREIHEELGVEGSKIGKKVLNLLGLPSPTSGINRDIKVYLVTLDKGQRVSTQAEVCNPRFLPKQIILELSTTTEITKQIIGIL